MNDKTKTAPTQLQAICEDQGLVCVADLGIFDSDGTLLFQAHPSNTKPNEVWWRFGVPGAESYGYDNVIAENAEGNAMDMHIPPNRAHYTPQDKTFLDTIRDLRAYARLCAKHEAEIKEAVGWL